MGYTGTWTEQATLREKDKKLRQRGVKIDRDIQTKRKTGRNKKEIETNTTIFRETDGQELCVCVCVCVCVRERERERESLQYHRLKISQM